MADKQQTHDMCCVNIPHCGRDIATELGDYANNCTKLCLANTASNVHEGAYVDIQHCATLVFKIKL